MKIITRYLLRTHLGPFLFALIALTGILFVNTVARRFADLAGKGLPLSVIGEVFYLSLPHILALTLPMAVLVAVLYAFAQLTADNEVTALKASGASLVRLMVPLIVAGAFAAGFMTWFNDRVLPDSNHRLKNLISDVAAKTPTLELTEQVVNPLRTSDFRTRYFLRAQRIDHETQRMWDVTIYDMSTPRKTRTVYADSGHIRMNSAQTNMLMTLYDGVIHEIDEQTNAELQRIFYRSQLIELQGVGTELMRRDNESRSDREMSIAMLKERIDSARAAYARLRDESASIQEQTIDRVLSGGLEPVYQDGLPPSAGYGRFTSGRSIVLNTIGEDELAYRTALETQRIASNAHDFELQANEFAVEYHKKFAIPFACIIFVLIGAPLAVRFPRGGVGMVIASSLAIFGIYYVSLIGGESLGDRGIIRPFWGPWAPNLLFGLLGVWALSRLGRETGTTRGGGWDDLWMTIRGIITAPFRRRRSRMQEIEA
jgi:lipopolysaccharide export system permease protein